MIITFFGFIVLEKTFNKCEENFLFGMKIPFIIKIYNLMQTFPY